MLPGARCPGRAARKSLLQARSIQFPAVLHSWVQRCQTIKQRRHTQIREGETLVSIVKACSRAGRRISSSSVGHHRPAETAKNNDVGEFLPVDSSQEQTVQNNCLRKVRARRDAPRGPKVWTKRPQALQICPDEA